MHNWSARHNNNMNLVWRHVCKYKLGIIAFIQINSIHRYNMLREIFIFCPWPIRGVKAIKIRVNIMESQRAIGRISIWIKLQNDYGERQRIIVHRINSRNDFVLYMTLYDRKGVENKHCKIGNVARVRTLSFDFHVPLRLPLPLPNELFWLYYCYWDWKYHNPWIWAKIFIIDLFNFGNFQNVTLSTYPKCKNEEKNLFSAYPVSLPCLR